MSLVQPSAIPTKDVFRPIDSLNDTDVKPLSPQHQFPVPFFNDGLIGPTRQT